MKKNLSHPGLTSLAHGAGNLSQPRLALLTRHPQHEIRIKNLILKK